MAQELSAKMTRLQSTLQRINAPNMRALEKLVLLNVSMNVHVMCTWGEVEQANKCHFVYRLEGVEARLQETSEAFEHSRHLAKKTKADFERTKKLR